MLAIGRRAVPRRMRCPGVARGECTRVARSRCAAGATPAILAANAKDLEAARRRSGLPRSSIVSCSTRRALTTTAKGVEEIAGLADCRYGVAEWTRPNAARLAQLRVPLGVIGIIYESRPNVTADAGALAVKAETDVYDVCTDRKASTRRWRSRGGLVAGLKSAGLPRA